MRRFLAKSPPVFAGLLIYFIIILVFPLAIGSYIFNEANELFSKKSIDAANFVLQQSAVTFDRFWETSDGTAYSLARNPAIQSAANLNRPAFASKDIIYFTSLLNRIDPNELSNTFRSKTVLFLKKPDAIVLRETVTFGIEQYYNHHMRYDNLTFEQWKSSILDQQHNRFFLPSMKIMVDELSTTYSKEYISYIHSFPLLTSVVMIESDSAKQLLSETIISDYGAALVVDVNGKPILSMGSQEILDAVDLSPFFLGEQSAYQIIGDMEMIVLCRESKDNELRYISINPVNEAMKDVISLRQLTIYGVFSILILGFLLSIWLSRRYTKPIQEVVGLLNRRAHDKEQPGGTYKVIKERVSELIVSHNELSQALHEQMILSRALFLGKLLEGTIRDQQELDRFGEYFSLDMKATGYIALHMSYQLSGESGKPEVFAQDFFSLAIDEVLQSLDNCSGYTHLHENNEITVILCLRCQRDEQAKQAVNDFVAAVQKHLQYQHSITPSIGVGMVYQQLLEVNYSFVESKIALESLQQGDGQPRICWYSNLNAQAKCGYYYPMEMEQKLITLAKRGQKDELLRNLDQLYRENCTNRALVRNTQIQWFCEMRATVMHIANSFKYDVDVTRLLHIDFTVTPEQDALELFTETYIMICETVNARKKSHNQVLITQILNRIQETYTNPNISVELLASAFGITPTYFSRFFKEQTNEVFSTYLEDMRMKRACALLVETDWSIDKIAEQTGYNSAYSFRRVFKKKFGVVPTEYRE